MSDGDEAMWDDWGDPNTDVHVDTHGPDAMDVGALFGIGAYFLDRQADRIVDGIGPREGGQAPTEEQRPATINAAGDLDDHLKWDDFVGQENLKRQLRVHIESAKTRGVALEHTLLASGRPGVGKGHPVSTPILTPSGWRKLGELAAGDEVIGSDGRPTSVTNVFDRGVLQVYDVMFSDGSNVVCDGDHLWRVRNQKGRWSTISVDDIEDDILDDRGRAKYSIPLVEPVQHPERDLPIEPYVLGALLANGSLDKGVIVTNDDAVIEEMQSRLPDGWVAKEFAPSTAARRWIVRGATKRKNPLIKELDALGLRGAKAANKFVPTEYFYASEQQRRDLLAGLMDCDGGIRSGRTSPQFHTTSRLLALAVQDLVRSLGGTARIRHLKRGETRVEINMTANPFLACKPKRDAWAMVRKPYRTIIAIRDIGDEDVRCIQVEADDSLYVTQDYLVTHNTTMGRIIAQEMGGGFFMLVPPFHRDALNDAVMGLEDGDILFIDEIHKLADHGKAQAENLLHIMEDKTLYLPIGEIVLSDITIIGATTDADKLPETIIDRFPIKPHFEDYSQSELSEISYRFEKEYGLFIPLDLRVAIAGASRRTPRVIRELIIAVRDLIVPQLKTVGAEEKHPIRVLKDHRDIFPSPEELFEFKNITPEGLTPTHREYITGIYRSFGRETAEGERIYVAGEMSLVTMMRMPKQGLARLERELIEAGLIDRTPQGRKLTPRGINKALEWT